MLNSRRKLKPKDALRFADVEPMLFRELAQVICKTGILPEKELHECWQMAELVHARFPEARHIADLAAGHGLLSWILVLIARRSENAVARTAVAVDITRPASAETLSKAILEHWPDLEGSVQFVEGSIASVRASSGPDTLFVATHACGSLSDRVMISAIASGSSLAIMPCCHSIRRQQETLSILGDVAGLSTEDIQADIDGIDQFRKDVLEKLDYRLSESFVDPEITTVNRIIIGEAPSSRSERIDSSALLNATAVKRSGEIRAYEKIDVLDVSDFEAARALALRPSREWRRVFDLSFWIVDQAEEMRLIHVLEEMLAGRDYSVNHKILGRFVHPETGRESVTFRLEMLSSKAAISKELALSLRAEICAKVSGLFDLRI